MRVVAHTRETGDARLSIDMSILTSEMEAREGNTGKSVIAIIIDSTEPGSEEREAVMGLLTEPGLYTSPDVAQILTAATPHRVTPAQVSGWRSRNNIRRYPLN